MTGQHRVVACFVQASVDGVVEGGVRKKLAALEGENFVDDKVSLEGRLGNREHGTVCRECSSCCQLFFLVSGMAVRCCYRLVQISKDIANVLNADRKSHHLRCYAGCGLLFCR